MEVKIGVRDIAREVIVESEETPEAIDQLVAAALTSGNPLRLVDDKGRLVIVPATNIGYVEIGAPESRRVGFGA